MPLVSTPSIISRKPPQSAYKAAHSGFETQETSSEVQNRSISGPKNGRFPPIFF